MRLETDPSTARCTLQQHSATQDPLQVGSQTLGPRGPSQRLVVAQPSGQSAVNSSLPQSKLSRPWLPFLTVMYSHPLSLSLSLHGSLPLFIPLPVSLACRTYTREGHLQMLKSTNERERIQEFMRAHSRKKLSNTASLLLASPEGFYSTEGNTASRIMLVCTE